MGSTSAAGPCRLVPNTASSKVTDCSNKPGNTSVPRNTGFTGWPSTDINATACWSLARATPSKLKRLASAGACATTSG